MTVSALPATHSPAFDPQAFVRDLEVRLQRCHRAQQKVARGTLISIVLSTPELVSAGIQVVRKGDLYWSRPATQDLRIGLGKAYSLNAQGRHRLVHLDRALRGLEHRWLVRSPDGLAAVPIAFTGFAFDFDDPMQDIWTGLPNALLQIPEILYERRGTECRLTFSLCLAQDADAGQAYDRWLQQAEDLARRIAAPPTRSEQVHSPLPLEHLGDENARQEWSRRVKGALGAIERKRLSKLVLIRCVRTQASRSLDFGRLLGRLETHYADCIHFAVPVGSRMLVGATPERLVCMERGVAVVDAIAGTQPRAGQDDIELLDSQKARCEHELVVNGIVQALGPISTELVVPQSPHLMTLPNVHHLWSPIRARLQPGVKLLAAADRLHPTPAVGGAPQRTAADWLQKHEQQARGWFTGALGWVSPQGDGELAVALRCGLIDQREALLFAGAGIVEGSDPEQEYQETQWKLQVMLEALSHA
jgi:menaquinone-specific isochorismate synthase